MPGETTIHRSRTGDPTANTLIDKLVAADKGGHRIPLDHLLPPDANHSCVADVACAELVLRLEAGEPARVIEYLARFPQLAERDDLVMYLINFEVIGRKKQKDDPPPTAAEYVEAFPHLREEIERFFAGPVEPVRPLPPSPDGYELIEEIGRGGMGVIYRAKDVAMKREVAVKVLQEQFKPDSDEAKRFVEETQITGQLQHPGIPPVYQVGKLEDGRPFLAMKLIKGQTLAKRLAEGREKVDTLGVFEAICQAVGYAHEAGVIHRDLKPQNVMVGAFNEVQVMDWGLAKFIGSKPPTPTGETQVAATSTVIEDPRTADRHGKTGVAGTPWYMAPEQAAGEQDTIDRRADVFALGGILCAMLTGKPPIEGTDPKAAQANAERGETTAAFELLTASGAEAELVALCKRCLSFHPADRKSDAGEVATAVAKLRKDADERAKQAEMDKAKAEVRTQAERKRRRVLQWGGGILATVLLLGISGTLIGLVLAIQSADGERKSKEDADEKRIIAEVARADEAKAKDLAEEKRTEAETNLKYRIRGTMILGSVFESLDPKAKYTEISDLRNSLRDNLKKAVAELDESAIGDPLVVAEMQQTLGKSLLGMGMAEFGLVVLTKARDTRLAKLGPDHPDTLDSMNNLAVAYRDAGELDKALPLYKETLDRMKVKLGPDHPSTLTTMNNLATGYHEAGELDKALPLLEETLKRREAKLGPEHPDTLQSMNNLAVAYRAVGQVDKALPLYELALKRRKAKLGSDHPDTLLSMNNLAVGYHEAGQLDKALPLYKETLERRKAKLGTDHPDTLRTQSNLAVGYEDAGQVDKALALKEDTLKLMKTKLGPDHPDTLDSMNNLAVGYHEAGQFDKALPLYKETLERMKVKLGPEHPSTLTAMNNLATGYHEAGELDKALPLLEETLKRREAKLGPEHPDTLQSMNNLAMAYCVARKGEKASSTFSAFIAVHRKLYPIGDPQFAGVLAQVSLKLLGCDECVTAEEMLREALAIREKKEADAWTTFNTKSMLGAALLGQKKYTDAEPLLVKGYDGIKTREKDLPPPAATRIPEALDRLIALYTATDKPDEVKKYKELRAKYPEAKKETPKK